jgi:hypothetical protein
MNGEETMNRKIYALVLALMLTLSMNAFAGDGAKGCQHKSDAKQCELKESCCKDATKCEDKSKCEKECEKKCDKKAGDKKVA